jgi:hypothetical protein
MGPRNWSICRCNSSPSSPSQAETNSAQGCADKSMAKAIEMKGI